MARHPSEDTNNGRVPPAFFFALWAICLLWPLLLLGGLSITPWLAAGFGLLSGGILLSLPRRHRRGRWLRRGPPPLDTYTSQKLDEWLSRCGGHKLTRGGLYLDVCEDAPASLYQFTLDHPHFATHVILGTPGEIIAHTLLHRDLLLADFPTHPRYCFVVLRHRDAAPLSDLPEPPLSFTSRGSFVHTKVATQSPLPSLPHDFSLPTFDAYFSHQGDPLSLACLLHRRLREQLLLMKESEWDLSYHNGTLVAWTPFGGFLPRFFHKVENATEQLQRLLLPPTDDIPALLVRNFHAEDSLSMQILCFDMLHTHYPETEAYNTLLETLLSEADKDLLVLARLPEADLLDLDWFALQSKRKLHPILQTRVLRLLLDQLPKQQALPHAWRALRKPQEALYERGVAVCLAHPHRTSVEPLCKALKRAHSPEKASFLFDALKLLAKRDPSALQRELLSILHNSHSQQTRPCQQETILLGTLDLLAQHAKADAVASLRKSMRVAPKHFQEAYTRTIEHIQNRHEHAEDGNLSLITHNTQPHGSLIITHPPNTRGSLSEMPTAHTEKKAK